MRRIFLSFLYNPGQNTTSVISEIEACTDDTQLHVLDFQCLQRLESNYFLLFAQYI